MHTLEKSTLWRDTWQLKTNIYFCFIDYAKAFDCVDHIKLWKILRWEYLTTLPASLEICMQVKKQQLELDMDQQTSSKLGKEDVKAVYCHPAYLTYMSSTSRGEGNGNPLQCSCLGNPMDGGACLATACGVAKSWTWLKWLGTHACMLQLRPSTAKCILIF